MNQMPTDMPRLAPPGAGIPRIERFVGGLLFAWKRWSGTRDRFVAEFTTERSETARLYESRADSILQTRVLIPRLRGLEDSSRYWSVYMTLDHLRIVNGQIKRVITELTNGRIPPGQASTASVKPRPDVDSEVIAAYESSCDALVATAMSVPDLNTRLNYEHPWFGPLNAIGWLAMAATHMGIHRAQIVRILSAISS